MPPNAIAQEGQNKVHWLCYHDPYDSWSTDGKEEAGFVKPNDRNRRTALIVGEDRHYYYVLEQPGCLLSLFLRPTRRMIPKHHHLYLAVIERKR